jgi:predicted 3-demethylubiquinone-9 3-methyltransferase (glyoxalase superfamily)
MNKITPCLWFDRDLEEAAKFYVSIFPDARILETQRYSKAGPLPEGTVLTMTFELAGQRFMGINGGEKVQYTHAVSMFVPCESQAEVDRYWDRLLEGGGKPVQCGWLTDRYGLSWQIVPTAMMRLLSDPDRRRAERATKAMMGMVKLDIAALERAAVG